MNYWLIKSDPASYSWQDLINEHFTSWDGVRNYQARNNLNRMKKGDKALFYHSNDKCIVGVVKIISSQAFPDPTSDDKRWLAVNVELESELNAPVNLEDIKNNIQLKEIQLLKQSRLSVMQLTKDEYNEILKMSKRTE